MNEFLRRIYVVAAIAFFGTVGLSQAQTAQPTQAGNAVTYDTVKIDGLDVFYREAGDKTKPAILLLHGFPTSSQMFRNLIPKLADKYHVVAPDYPGFRKQLDAAGRGIRLHFRQFE